MKFLYEVSAFLIQDIFYNKYVDATYSVPLDAEGVKALVFKSFEDFHIIFDIQIGSYRDPINYRAFNNPNFISTSYDTDKFFQTALNALFTYKINLGGKDVNVNLFALMPQADKDAFIARLEAKLQEEYARWQASH